MIVHTPQPEVSRVPAHTDLVLLVEFRLHGTSAREADETAAKFLRDVAAVGYSATHVTVRDAYLSSVENRPAR